MWFFILVPFLWVAIAKIIFRGRISFKECAMHLASVVPVTAIIFAVSYYTAVGDTELIHGEVLSKVRDNSSHQESYSCNCHQSCSGSGSSRSCSTVCQTCWRTVYTVDWFLKTTIGNIGIDSDRSYSSGVWNNPDPKLYVNAYVGEPCTKTSYFKNYIKASGGSIFNQSSYVVNIKAKNIAYPEVYNKYQVNNIINDVKGFDSSPYENALSEKLKKIGAKNQVNIIYIFTENTDKNYRYFVEKNFIGGKKNDVIVIVSLASNKIQWADAFTYGLSQGNQLMITKIRDFLIGKEIDINIFNESISIIEQSFKRKPMKDFEYLSKSINPPIWVIVMVAILQLIANVWITIFNIKNGD